MKQSEKSKKISGLLQEILPHILQTSFSPDEVGFVTVNEVEVSSDLTYVDVYVRSIGGPSTFANKLQKRSHDVLNKLFKEIWMPKKIHLRFKKDRKFEHAERLKELSND